MRPTQYSFGIFQFKKYPELFAVFRLSRQLYDRLFINSGAKIAIFHDISKLNYLAIKQNFLERVRLTA